MADLARLGQDMGRKLVVALRASLIPWILLLILSFVQVGVTRYLILELGRHDAVLVAALHREVLSNSAPSPAQYQMYPFAVAAQTVMEMLGLNDRVPQNARRLALIYEAFYFFGNTALLISLYSFLSRFGSSSSALLATTFFAALQPVLWWDNYHHPSDPWGLLLATLLADRIYRREDDGRTLLLSLASGLVWEKHFLILPLYLVYRFRDEDKRHVVVFAFVLGVTAVAGQVFYRLYFGFHREWAGPTLSHNLGFYMLVGFVLTYVILFGLALLATAQFWRVLGFFHKAVLVAVALLPCLYLAFGGRLGEARGYVVLVPLLYPALTFGIDRWLATPRSEDDSVG